MLAKIEAATASPVLPKSEEALLQLIREGITYYDGLLESGRVDFLRETTSVESAGNPMGRAPSGTWKGTFEFFRTQNEMPRDTRCYSVRKLTGTSQLRETEQYAYDGEAFERLRETFNGIMLSRRSENRR